MHTYYVYILTNVLRTVMYIGITNDLERRLAEHRARLGGAYRRRYRVYTLVYAELFQHIDDAIAHEKRIKGWSRDKKSALVEAYKPSWADLSATEWFPDPSLRSG